MQRKVPTAIANRKRLLIAFAIFCAFLVLLCIRVGYQQVVKGETYAKMAVAQQTRDELVEAKRGNICDRNGEVLAASTVRYSVWVRPTAASTESERSELAGKLASLLDKKKKDILKQLSSTSTQVKIAKYQELSVAEKVREAKLPGVTVTEETKRYYPLGSFAAHLLGSVTDDNNGLSGLEQYYNRTLRGVAGRWIESKDTQGKSLTYGEDTYYEAEDGDQIVLTIDEILQNYAEDATAKSRKDTGALRSSCLIMEPKTGEVLAMASSPEFNPNDSRKPRKSDKEEFEKMSGQEQNDYWNQMWRNPLINDTYEPGSTFKLLTTAMALEDNVVSEDEYFECGGGLTVNGTLVKCAIYPGSHGSQTLKQGVGNSCNPVFMRLAQRVGGDRFCDYLDLFGITDTTGIDYPGEAEAQVFDPKDVGPMELSAMGFGQGIAVTPIQLLTTINALACDGVMVQPHLLKEVQDENGKTKRTVETKEVRKIISKGTSKKIREYMEYVVDEGSGTAAQVKGYRIGGKTGTSEKRTEGSSEYSERIVSFVGMAPINDPQISILLIVDEPQGEVWGSDTAAPWVQKILKKSLRYLNIEQEK